LIELLIVVAIIGFVAAIAIPNLLISLQKSRQKSAMGDMRTIAIGIESYITDNTFVPQVPTGVVGNLTQPFFVPFHIKVLPTIDPWGNEFRWESRNDHSENYSIICYGRNQVGGGPMGAPLSGVFYDTTRLPDFNNDIVYSSGSFTFAPRKK